MCAKCKIAIGKPCSNVSPDLFGLFLEDINWACEGGLNANLVMNYSFEDTYIDQKTTEISLTSAKKPAAIQADRLRYWHGTGCTLESRKSDGISENSWMPELQQARTAHFPIWATMGARSMPESVPCGLLRAKLIDKVQ